MAQVLRFDTYRLPQPPTHAKAGKDDKDTRTIAAAIRHALRAGHRKAAEPIKVGDKLVRFFPDVEVTGEVIDAQTRDEGRQVKLLVAGSEQKMTLTEADLASCTIAPHKSYAAFLGHIDTLIRLAGHTYTASRLRPLKMHSGRQRCRGRPT